MARTNGSIMGAKLRALADNPEALRELAGLMDGGKPGVATWLSAQPVELTAVFTGLSALLSQASRDPESMLMAMAVIGPLGLLAADRLHDEICDRCKTGASHDLGTVGDADELGGLKDRFTFPMRGGHS